MFCSAENVEKDSVLGTMITFAFIEDYLILDALSKQTKVKFNREKLGSSSDMHQSYTKPRLFGDAWFQTIVAKEHSTSGQERKITKSSKQLEITLLQWENWCVSPLVSPRSFTHPHPVTNRSP